MSIPHLTTTTPLLSRFSSLLDAHRQLCSLCQLRCLNTFILAAQNLFSELGLYYQLTDPNLLRLSFSSSSPCDDTPSDQDTATPPAAIPAATMSYKPNGPSFRFYGTFSGKGLSALRQLIKFDYKISSYKTNNSVISPKTYLNSLNILLINNTKAQTKSHPNTITILNKKNLFQ